MQTEPEQWAVTEADIEGTPDWAFSLASTIVLGNYGCGHAAVLIQRAFEERERKLREAAPAQPSGDEVEAVARKLETLFVVQMDAQADDTLPSSIHREQGRVWLEGWFDLKDAARAALGEKP